MAVTWANCQVTLGELQPWADNPRLSSKRQAQRILDSWRKFGQVKTVAIGPSNEVYDGHQRLSALLTVHGPSYQVDARRCSRELTDEERRALVVTLHAGAVGSWDWDALSGWDAGELQQWGFDGDTLTNWQKDVTALGAMLSAEAEQPPDDPGAQVDKADELRQKWGVETGQLWKLGEHRLICGDCTDRAVVDAVAFGDRMDLWLTDPPYAVSYADKNRYLNAVAFGNRIQVPIENDHLSLEDAADLWERAARIALEVCADHAPYYWFACQGGDQMMMMMMRLSEAGWRVRHELIWVKNNHVLGRTDYNYKHEPILYGWKKDGKHRFFGGFQTSVLEFPKPQNSDLHPTTKPVELIERLIANSSQAGEIVLDTFLGSGTTLIACERLGRRCRAVEISPGYVGVALQRWADMTGGAPELVEQ